MEKGKVVVLLVIAAVSVLGLSLTVYETGPVKTKIGSILPLTGGAIELGHNAQRGIDLANERLNSRYNIVYEDGRCDGSTGVTAARKLMDVDGVKFVIGPLCTPPYMAAAPIFNENEVSFMHVSGVADTHIGPAGRFGIPGMTGSQFREMRHLAGFIYNDMGVKKMSVLSWNQEWALQYRRGFLKHFKEMGGKIVADELFNTGTSDYRTELLKIKNSGAEGVLVVGLNFQTAEILQELEETGADLLVFGQLDNEDDFFLEASGDAGEGMIWAMPKIDLGNEETRWFVKTYMERYGKNPNYYAFVSYDALKLYDMAISVCGQDPECVTDTILNVENYSGVSGTINFENGVIDREFEIHVIRNGRITSLTS